MNDADHELIIKLARQVKMPKHMYDTPSTREALNRFIQAVELARCQPQLHEGETK